MARFRKMALSFDKREDDPSMFGDGFVVERFQSEESSIQDIDSSDSLDEPSYKSGAKRKAERKTDENSLASPTTKVLKKRVGRKAAWPYECVDEIIGVICESD